MRTLPCGVATMPVLLFFAFLAGIVTVLSPCVLPVLPALLSAGAGEGRYRPLGVILGLVSSFLFFTLTLTALVQATGISPNFLRTLAIVMIAFFGLVMLFPKLGDWFAEKTAGIADLGASVQQKATAAGTGFWSGFILGIALGLIWTPCAGPILAAITTLVATHAITWETVLLAGVYSLGAALPMFAIILGGNKLTHFARNYTEVIRKVFGALMLLSAVAIAFHFDVALQQWTLKYFPMVNIEDNASVQAALENLREKQPRTSNFSVATPNPVAPDFSGITEWINSPPLTLQDLQGKVVLVDFWTYSCINCVRTLPYLKKWYAAYKDKNFVIVGVHTPEFEFEKNPSNVKDAVKRFEIAYPVALDNQYATWQNYNNRFWPAHYLIDQQGIVRDYHFGEGAYAETENAIRRLLGLAPLEQKEEAPSFHPLTPETYLGYDRADRYVTPPVPNTPTAYTFTPPIPPDHVALQGNWTVHPEFIQANKDATLTLNFLATHVYLVMQSDTPQTLTPLLNNVPQAPLTVQEARMYEVFQAPYGRHTLTLPVPPNTKLYVFTFGD